MLVVLNWDFEKNVLIDFVGIFVVAVVDFTTGTLKLTLQYFKGHNSLSLDSNLRSV